MAAWLRAVSPVAAPMNLTPFITAMRPMNWTAMSCTSGLLCSKVFSTPANALSVFSGPLVPASDPNSLTKLVSASMSTGPNADDVDWTTCTSAGSRSLRTALINGVRVSLPPPNLPNALATSPTRPAASYSGGLIERK
jgi:hypothetical protein